MPFPRVGFAPCRAHSLRSHTCRTRSVFVRVHAAPKTDYISFRVCGRETLRGWLARNSARPVFRRLILDFFPRRWYTFIVKSVLTEKLPHRRGQRGTHFAASVLRRRSAVPLPNRPGNNRDGHARYSVLRVKRRVEPCIEAPLTCSGVLFVYSRTVYAK